MKTLGLIQHLLQEITTKWILKQASKEEKNASVPTHPLKNLTLKKSQIILHAINTLALSYSTPFVTHDVNKGFIFHGSVINEGRHEAYHYYFLCTFILFIL